jgi:hypothetical protein
MTVGQTMRYVVPVPADRLDDVAELRAIAQERAVALRATGRDLHPGADVDGPVTVALALDEGFPVPDAARELLAEFGGQVLRSRFPSYGRPGEMAYLIITIPAI